MGHQLLDLLMKLVMCFVSGDGCTYSCDVAIPFEYESAEAALVDFETLATKARMAVWPESGTFIFANRELQSTEFFVQASSPDAKFVQEFYPPDFLTVDEWFAQEAV